MKDLPARIDPDPWFELKLIGWLTLVFAVAALMVAAVVQNNLRDAEKVASVKQARALVLETDAMLASLHAGEAARGTYFLTGDEAAKKSVTENFAGVDQHLKQATTLAFENSDQLDRLGAISALLQKRMDLNKQAMRIIPQGAKLLTTPEAQADLREIKRLVAANRGVENRRVTEIESVVQRHARRAEQILYAGGALILILLAVVFRVVRMDVKARRVAAAALQSTIEERAAEVAATKEKLELENIEQQWGQVVLQRLVNHHELILNSMQEGIFVVSKNGHIISANPAAAHLARRELKQLTGKSIGTVLLDDDRLPYPWEKHFLRTPIKNGRPILPKPGTVKQADGGLVDVQLACYPTRDRENLTGAVITVTAATPAAPAELKRAEMPLV
jgi:PAS domain S-box-containing protein